MTGQDGVVADIVSQLSEVRATGEAADGLVRVEIDGTSAIVDLVIEPKAMRLPSEDLAAAVREAFDAARAAVQEQLSATAPSSIDAGEVQATLDEIGDDAQRRLNEVVTIAGDLSTRIDRFDRLG